MPESVTIITPTGDRPEMLEILRGCIDRQTVKPVTWLIIDDGDTSSESVVANIPYVNYIRRKKKEKGRQMLEALKHVKTDIVVIMEDDDWYGVDYLKFTLKAMGDVELFGWADRVYYHLPSSTCKRLNAHSWAIWALTAFRSNIITRITELLPNVKRHAVDSLIWKGMESEKKTGLQKIKCKRDWFYLGFKGYPKGRTGMTNQHRKVRFRVDDADGEILQRIVGADKVKYDALRNKL